MKRRMTKAVSIPVALLMALSLLAGCGAGTGGETQAITEATTAAKTEATTVALEPLQIDWLAYQTLAEPDPNSEVVKMVEERFNAKFKFWFVDYQKWDDVLNVKMASGDMPDFLLIKNRGNLPSYAKQGILAEMPLETMQKYAPNYFKALNKYDPEGLALNITKIDGKNYGITSMNLDGSYPFAIVWRTDWLKNVGIEKIPETLEEFEAAMYKFRNDDPDKNGIKDTYGLSNTSLDKIYGAYGIIEPIELGTPSIGTPNVVVKEDNSVVYAATQPEAKEALTVLAKWYKDGLIDPEFVTGENTGGYWGFSQAFFNNRVGVTGKMNHFHYSPPLTEDDPGGPCYLEMIKLNPNSTFDLGKAPIGPNGKSGGKKVGIINASYGVTTKSKDPRMMETCLKIFDASFDENDFDFFITMQRGIKDVDYTVNKEGVVQTKHKDAAEEIAKGISVLNNPGNPDIQKKTNPPRYKRADEKCVFPGYVPPIIPNTEEATKYNQNLGKLTAEAYIKIMTGEKPIEYFDEFVRQFNSNGGTEAEAAMTAAYKKMIGK